MQVHDGMNRNLVVVGPQHTLRDAAQRMTARGVGAAVVIDPEQGGPGIITERDLMRVNGAGLDIDLERVADHLSVTLSYAAADWPLERAAAEMIRAGLRHIVVVDGGEVVGILSMRDIVRCWTTTGADCELPS